MLILCDLDMFTCIHGGEVETFLIVDVCDCATFWNYPLGEFLFTRIHTLCGVLKLGSVICDVAVFRQLLLTTMAPAWELSALRGPLCKICKFERSQNTKICKMLANLYKLERSQKQQKKFVRGGPEVKNCKN